MQITPADSQPERRLQLVPGVHAQGRPHQFSLEGSHRFVERAVRKFLRQFLRDGETLKFLRQIFHAEMFVAIRQDQAALDYVLQLTNIARPVMFDQRLLEAHRETVKPFVVGLRKRLQEILGQQWYVFRSLAQGRHVDADDGNAEVEIFPKGTFLHHFFQVAAGGANDADLDGMGGVRAQAFQTAFLQYAQELRLQGQGQVANLVEKDGPAPGLFEAPPARLDGAGKGAFLVAKKFIFNQRLRQSARGKRHERLLGARAQIMDGARHNSFTRPALARDEYASKNL